MVSTSINIHFDYDCQPTLFTEQVKLGEHKIQVLEEKSKKDKIRDEELISQLQQKVHSQSVGM